MRRDTKRNLKLPLNSRIKLAGQSGGLLPPADEVIKQLAHRATGPGFNNGSAPPTGDGLAKTYTATFRNDSGAAISTCSVVLQGWTLRTTGTTDASAPFAVTGTVEYPDGTTVGTIASTSVTPGANVESADVVLSAPIPTGATFRVRLASTPANGATYIANLGFAGLRAHALRSTLRKACFAAFGDSIMTNNSGSVFNAALTRAGAYCNSISGTTAQTYGASAAANFAKQADLAAKLGVTHVVSNWSTNDANGGRSLAQIQGDLTAMRDMVRAAGMLFVQCTMLPRTRQKATIAATLTAVGNTITALVADASQFVVGHAYVIAGVVESNYNGNRFCTAIDTVADTVTFQTTGVPASPATGVPTLRQWKQTSSVEFMDPDAAAFNPGGASLRGLFNAWVRGGAFDDYIEWGDVMEPIRDAGRWKVAGEDALIPEVQTITVSSVISTSQFNSDYSRGTNTIALGLVQAITGANAGAVRTGNGNTNGDITLTTAWVNAQQIGDTYYALPGSSWLSDDGVHPRAALGTTGGQALLDAATVAWMAGVLA